MQLFTKRVPIEILREFLKKVCSYVVYGPTPYFLFDICAYKKAMYENHIQKFIETVGEYYHNSKKEKYIETRKMDFNNFATILRQIMKSHNIPYSNKIKYVNSNYTILYQIYLSNEDKIN